MYGGTDEDVNGDVELHILRYEHLEVDYDTFCKRFNITNALPLNSMNKNVYKLNSDPEKKSQRLKHLLYTPEMIKEVERVF